MFFFILSNTKHIINRNCQDEENLGNIYVNSLDTILKCGLVVCVEFLKRGGGKKIRMAFFMKQFGRLHQFK